MGNEKNIRIRCSRETKNDFYALKSSVDAELSNEEFIEKIVTYFEDDESRLDALRRAGDPPGGFRGPG